MKNSVIAYFENTVSLFPEKIAVKDNEGCITFSELKVAGKVIASVLCRSNIFKKPVGVYIPKGCKAIEAFCGISYSGNFYVPLDTKSPATRIESILTVLEAKVIITDTVHVEALRKFYQGEVIVLEDVIAANNIDEELISQTINHVVDTDAVYSIFTSGSTGIPKGVVVSHRGVLDYIDWAVDTFKFDSSLIIGNQAPFYFDNSTLDIYLMYATGSTLVVIPEGLFSFPAKLIGFLNEEKINFVFWVPFVLMSVANMNILASIKPEYLHDVFFAGEVMPNKHLNYWRKILPECRYVNLYGPTEITVDCTYYVVERKFSDSESLPIGFPCKNSDVLIIKDDGTLAKTNEQGELCVRGTSLALGYYNDPEKTAKAFIQNPFNKHYPEIIYCTGDLVYTNEFDEIMYVGRKDSQIKHNGYRIELGEIENAVLGTKLIKNVCVVYNFVGKEICMFYENETEVGPGELRKRLINKIPRYMIPAHFIRVDVLKQNTNGKIDRLFYKNQVNECK